MYIEMEAGISQWAEEWWVMAQCARGFWNSGKATRRMGKKSLFPLYPHHSPHPSLARPEHASTKEDEMRAEHGVHSTQHNSQTHRLAEKPIQ